MKKRSISLRIALWLAVGTWVSAFLVASTGTLAKYVAQGNGEGQARYAKFSVLIGDQHHNGGTSKTWAAEAYDQLVTLKGIDYGSQTQDFKLPLFDYEYSTHYNDRSKTTTVLSADGSLVVAPGIGIIGVGKHNPNDIMATSNPNDWSQIFFKIKNSSEVTVRVKIEYDPVNSVIPQLNSAGTVVSGNGATANAKLPIFLRPYRTDNPQAFLISNCTGLTNIFAAANVPDDLRSQDSVSGRNYSDFEDNFKADKWIYLEPGQETGGPEATDPPNVGICWYWLFARASQWGHPNDGWPDGMSDQGGYAEKSNGVAGNLGDQAFGANWDGFSSSTILPYLPIAGTDPDTGAAITPAKIRANNIDRFDTQLGLAAAKGTLEVVLAFRITVEQVD